MNQLDAPPPVVRMSGIGKRFGGVQALTGVDLDIRAGEVHALVGENGAGKSTILKILLGIHAPDTGTVEVDGAAVTDHTPRAARDRGIAMIFQELSLVPSLTIAQNVLLNREPTGPTGLIDDRAARARTAALLADLGLDLAPDTPVDRLSTGARQLVEIAKALSQQVRVLVLDEPTSALTAADTRRLFTLVARLKAAGVAIVYVSHRMAEIFAIADRITVLRDGRWVTTQDAAALDMQTLIGHIVGRTVQAFDWREGQPEVGAALLEVRQLAAPPRLQDVSLTVHEGEVVGLAGLMGSGRSELAMAVCGHDRPRGGTVALRGRPVDTRGPAGGIRAGVVLVPEDRRTQGLVLEHSVRDNICLAVLPRVSRAGFLRPGAARALVGRMLATLRIKAAHPGVPVATLSGGNQQKVVLAKWLATEPDVLVLDEPTAGIDIGSKAEIVALIRQFVATGRGVLLISSELPELLALSDRILVLVGGRVRHVVTRADIDGWVAGETETEARLGTAERRLQELMQPEQLPSEGMPPGMPPAGHHGTGT